MTQSQMKPSTLVTEVSSLPSSSRFKFRFKGQYPKAVKGNCATQDSIEGKYTNKQSVGN
jgi:hypothetical protein